MKTALNISLEEIKKKNPEFKEWYLNLKNPFFPITANDKSRIDQCKTQLDLLKKLKYFEDLIDKGNEKILKTFLKVDSKIAKLKKIPDYRGPLIPCDNRGCIIPRNDFFTIDFNFSGPEPTHKNPQWLSWMTKKQEKWDKLFEEIKKLNTRIHKKEDQIYEWNIERKLFLRAFNKSRSIEQIEKEKKEDELIRKANRNSLTKKRKKREGLWSNRKLIKEFYILRDILSKKLRMEFEVDHVIPLQGDSVSGLHSHLNLQVIPKKINRTKSNKIDLEEIDQMLIDAEKKYLTYRQLILKVKM
jgi:hypothetical protein